MGTRWLEQLRDDIRDALGAFRRAPGVVTLVITTLALGIGATTAIFSVVQAVLLNPLPYPGSERLVRLMVHLPLSESPTGRPLRTTVALTAAEILRLGERSQTLEMAGTAGPALMSAVGHEDAGHVQGARVSSTIFGMVGAQPQLGRVFHRSDEAPGSDPVMLLSHSAWQRYFGGDPQVLGRALTFGHILGPRRQSRHIIVGVMPPGFEFPYWHTQFWLPFQSADAAQPPLRGPLLGRLAKGVSLEAAAAEIAPIVRDIRGHSTAVAYELVREQDELVAPVRPALVVLMGAVGFVLLIACVNVAGLLLGRGPAREREMAIRAALGADRARLTRQLLTESLLLAFAGGVAGVALAVAGVEHLRTLATTLPRIDLGAGLNFPRVDEIRVDASVLVLALCVSTLAGVTCGIIPALRGSRPRGWDLLRTGEPVSSRLGRGHGSQAILIVVEVATALVLLAGGGLLVHSFVKLSRVDAGYDPARVLTFQVNLALDRYSDARLRAFAEDLVAAVRTIAGVRAAAYANQLPMVQLRDTAGGLWRTPDAARKPSPGGPDARLVSREFLEVMGIRVVAGRGFGEHDGAGRPRGLLVNEALARRDFSGENPVGQFVFVGRDTTPWEIVGVVQNVRQFRLDREADPQFFIDLRQWPGQGMPVFPVGAYYAVLTAGDPMAIVADVRRALSGVDAQAKLFNVASMRQLVATTISRPRLYALLVGIFAAVAVTLAAVGIFGVVAGSVAQRTREIGIRLALGAQRTSVISLVARQSAEAFAIGVVVGLAAAAALTRYLEGLLFGLTPQDPATIAAVVVLFAVVAMVASYVPARRAMRVEPLVALRHE